MVRAALFDAYGTLFDVHSAVRRHAARLGPQAEAVSALWRARQLEYSWVLSLAGRYADFWQLTGDALDFALASHGIGDPGLRAALMTAYRALAAYPEVPVVLDELRARGLVTAILSNGTPAMLRDAIASAGLDGLFDQVLSVDAIGIYKPDPRVYQLAVDRLGLPAAAIAFQSSNAWDAAGAAAFGFRVHWINRSGLPAEYPGLPPAAMLGDLSALPAALA